MHHASATSKNPNVTSNHSSNSNTHKKRTHTVSEPKITNQPPGATASKELDHANPKNSKCRPTKNHNRTSTQTQHSNPVTPRKQADKQSTIHSYQDSAIHAPKQLPSTKPTNIQKQSKNNTHPRKPQLNNHSI
eukprot:gene3434-2385_t